MTQEETRRDNLRSVANLPEEEARAIQVAGGKASVEARRKRKEVAEALKAVLLDVDPKSGKTYLEAIAKQCSINTAKKGTVKDLKAIAEIWGEMVQAVEINVSDMPKIDLSFVGGDDEESENENDKEVR